MRQKGKVILKSNEPRNVSKFFTPKEREVNFEFMSGRQSRRHEEVKKLLTGASFAVTKIHLMLIAHTGTTAN